MGQINQGAYKGFTVKELPGGLTVVETKDGRCTFNANGIEVEEAPPQPKPKGPSGPPDADDDKKSPAEEGGWTRNMRTR